MNPTVLLWIGAALWGLALLLGLLRAAGAARGSLTLGCAVAAAGCFLTLPAATALQPLGIHLADQALTLQFAPESLWLMGFGLIAATLACWSGSPQPAARSGWCVGAAISLLGAFGVFGLQDGYGFLIAWELMSLGGAVLLLSERLGEDAGQRSLFMLALLEVGAVALLLAILLLGRAAGSVAFGGFAQAGAALSPGLRVFVGCLFLIGFGAKLGLLPFYEWYPGAYSSGSGASGALMSGVVLNAAYFGLSRALIDWLPADSGGWLFGLGVTATAVGVASAIFTALYAFQQDDWRGLLSFSSAENAALAVTALGCALIFREDGQHALAGLAWTVSVLHLGGHALVKGGLFLAGDSVYDGSGSYAISQRGWLRRGGLLLGVGAGLCAMSLAAMPPQIGFASEWYLFQTVFQGFHLGSTGGRLTLALAGAGLALTTAIAFATFVKLFGLGLLGAAGDAPGAMRRSSRLGVFVLGVIALATAAGLPLWLGGLDGATQAQFGTHAARHMVDGWLLVPLTAKFAFISPSKLVIVMPLLAILPLLLLLNARRHAVRRAPVWFGGLHENAQLTATTPLSFANALRTFYSFVYRPRVETQREHVAQHYFISKLRFDADVAPVFGPLLFVPARRTVWWMAGKLRALQSGDLNFYLALIGALLILILALTLT